MGPRRALAAQLVDVLDAAGVYATTSPAALTANLPGVLVPPPALVPGTYTGPDAVWRLVLVASQAEDATAAWDQLDELLDVAWDALDAEHAEATSYQLPNGAAALPAYVLTITTPGK